MLDQSPPFLGYLDQHGIVPGSAVTVTERQPLADAATVRTGDGRLVSVGLAAGEKVRVGGGRVVRTRLMKFDPEWPGLTFRQAPEALSQTRSYTQCRKY